MITQAVATPATEAIPTKICLRLLVGDHVFLLGQLGPSFCYVCEPVDCPPCRGLLVMHIDNTVCHLLVELIDGMRQGERRVAIKRHGGSAVM